MFSRPINRRSALCSLAAVVGLAFLPTPIISPRKPKYVAVCASSPCKFRNAGEVAQRRDKRADAERDAKAHTKKTGHETDVLEVME